MTNNIIPVLILLLSFTLFSCGNGKRNVKEFYLPIEQLKEGLVYEYRSLNNDQKTIDYWYYRTHQRDSGLFLVGQYYDQNLNVMQLATEEIVSNGSIIHSYRLYDVDSTGQRIVMDAQLKSVNAFPFEVSDSTGIFLMELKFVQQQAPEISTTLVRNRRYKGDATYTFKGKQVDCIEFSVIEQLEFVDQEKGGISPQKNIGKELYAKDIGLIYYKKAYNADFIIEYELADIYSMEVLEQKLKRLQ